MDSPIRAMAWPAIDERCGLPERDPWSGEQEDFDAVQLYDWALYLRPAGPEERRAGMPFDGPRVNGRLRVEIWSPVAEEGPRCGVADVP